MSSHDLMLAYANARELNGFKSDSDFMNAWLTDPVKWNQIFELRMRLIESLS